MDFKESFKKIGKLFRDIQVDDVVMNKIGGPLMLVVDEAGEDSCVCQWWSDKEGKNIRETFKLKELKKIASKLS